MEKKYEKPLFAKLNINVSNQVFFVASDPAKTSASAPNYTKASTSGWF